MKPWRVYEPFGQLRDRSRGRAGELFRAFFWFFGRKTRSKKSDLEEDALLLAVGAQLVSREVRVELDLESVLQP